MFGEEDHNEFDNEYENLPKKFKSPEGNHALSAEILEQVAEVDAVQCIDRYIKVFLYLNHEDLMTLLTVCKFWAAVAERPQLWTDFRQVATNLLKNNYPCFRLVISKHNSSKKIISHLLSLHRWTTLTL